MSAPATQTLGRQAIEDLRVREISSPERFAALDDSKITELVARWDKDSTGPGALDHRLKQALKHPEAKPAIDRTDDRMAVAESWVTDNLPDLTGDRRGVAVLAAWRVLFRGHDLSVEAHGEYVRQAARDERMAA